MVQSPTAAEWFWEYHTPEFIQGTRIEEVIYRGSSRYQTVEMVRMAGWGRCLILDSKIQSAEVDEFIYHEALVHPTLLSHPHPRTVFIAGGGEGATLREVLAHGTVERVVMVDIDQEVIELCKVHLPLHHRGAFDDPRLELHFTDAKEFLATTPETFDVVILDLPDPLEGGPAYLLYTQNFYRLVLSKLNPGGVVVTQAEACSITMFNEAFTPIYHTMASVFGQHLHPYRVVILSFGGLWGFLMASLSDDPTQLSPAEVDRRLAERVSAELRFYDGETHAGLFRLPKYLRRALAEETRLITEDNPVFIF